MAFVTKKETGAKTVIKGFLTGGTQAALTYPTEYIKTQLQLQSRTNPEYAGIADCARKTIKSHGFAGLYSGASVRIIGAGFQQMFRWGAYTNFSSAFRDEDNKIAIHLNILCGVGAGVTEALCSVIPIETVKTRVTDDVRRGTGKYRGSGDAILKITKSEGPSGLYRGAFPTILKQATNQAVRFPLQSAAVEVICGDDAVKKQSAFYNGVGGLIAGAGSVVASQPQDCVKSRMQGEAAKELYKGTADCVRQMWRQEGALSFYAGAVPRMIQVGMSNAIAFALYPTITKVLNTYM